MDRLQLPATLDQLEPARQFIMDAAERAGVPMASQVKLDLVLEEALVNVIHHAYGDAGGTMELRCLERVHNGQRLFVAEIRDRGPSFDPFDAKPPDLDADLDDRPVGGLGIHFIRQMADDAGWRRENDENVLHLGFALGPVLE
ncbi:MAG: ATP-binding protein [Desulfovibrionaceae bacterium]